MTWQNIAEIIHKNDLDGLHNTLKDQVNKDVHSLLVNGDIPMFVWKEIHDKTKAAEVQHLQYDQKLQENIEKQKSIEEQIKELQEKQKILQKEQKKIIKSKESEEKLSKLHPIIKKIVNSETELIKQFAKKISQKDWKFSEMNKEDVSVALHLIDMGYLVNNFSKNNLDGKFCSIFVKDPSISNILKLDLFTKSRLSYSLYLLKNKNFPFLHSDCSICVSDADETAHFIKEYNIDVSFDSFKDTRFTFKDLLFLNFEALHSDLAFDVPKCISLLTQFVDIKKNHKEQLINLNFSFDEWKLKFFSFSHAFEPRGKNDSLKNIVQFTECLLPITFPNNNRLKVISSISKSSSCPFLSRSVLLTDTHLSINNNFSCKVKFSKCEWNGIGFFESTIVKDKSQISYTSIGHGFYGISKNAYSWHSSLTNFNVKQNGFPFTENDIIQMDWNFGNSALTFTNLTSTESYTITIPVQFDFWYPVVLFYNAGTYCEIVQ